MPKVRKGRVAIISLVLAILFVSSNIFAAPAAKVIKLRMGTIYNDPVARPAFNAFGSSMKKFVELVKEKSGGRVEISPYYSSVLGASDELFEQLRRGELDIFYGQPMSTVDKRFGAFSVPYIFADYNEVTKLIASKDAPLFKLAQSWVDKNNAYLVASGASVFRGFFNIKHRVAKVSDVRDLKVRIYEDPVVNLFWKSICNATSMAYSEVYTALQTKTVDGLEFADTSVLSSKYYDVGKYFSDIDWQWTWAANIIFSKKTWKGIPDDLKNIITDCAWEAMDLQKKEEIANKAMAEGELKSKGVEVYHLTAVERKTWIDFARSLDPKMREAIGAETFDAVMNALK